MLNKYVEKLFTLNKNVIIITLIYTIRNINNKFRYKL